MAAKDGDNLKKFNKDNDAVPELIKKFTLFVDQNIREIKYGAYALGTIGVFMVMKSIHSTRVITSAKDIPVEFIKNNIRLHGNVKSVNQYGVLQVSHIPIIKQPTWLKPTTISDTNIQIKLACIDVSLDGCKWLHENIVNKTVWFQVLTIPEGESEEIVAAVYRRKYLLLPKMCINKKLIQLGLSRVSHLSPDEVKKLSDFQNRLLIDLIKHENIAMKKQVGVWKNLSEPESKIKKTGKVLVTIMRFPVKIIEMMFKKVKSFIKR